MKIEINKGNTEARVQSAFDECVKWIQANAAQGIDTTELMIDKDIAADVRDRLEKEVEGIHFCIVDRRPNPFTYRIEHFTSKTVGNIRYYKVKIVI
jgi:hypothetical protein